MSTHIFYKLIRSLFFKCPPEVAHAITLYFFKFLSPFIFTKAKVVKPQQLWGINFPNPVGLAAGLDKNGDFIVPLSKLGFGFIEVGTVTPRPQSGNPRPRLFRLPEAEAIINRMGFNNEGVDYLIHQVKCAKFKGVLGINIGKNFDTNINRAIEDYLICFRKVYPYASYVTVNVSSPNTPELRDLQNANHLANLLSALKLEQSLQKQRFSKYVPLLLKISPDLTKEQVRDIAELLLQYKVDGVIATNTTTEKNAVENLPCGKEQGGLSGKPLTQQSTIIIKQLSEHLNGQIPIIATGGIMTAEDAMEKITAGASLVQIYTGMIYQGPGLINDILRKLT